MHCFVVRPHCGTLVPSCLSHGPSVCPVSECRQHARAACAAGKLAEVERRVRGLDEYAHASDTGAAVADLAARVGSVESSVAHLAKVGRPGWAAARSCAVHF